MPEIQSQEKTFTIVIDAGHGGHDPGAMGSIINEKVINLSVALKLGNLISENMNDVKVIYTRKTDRFISLDERTEIANRNKAHLFISIHTNSVLKGNQVTGTETFTLGLARNDESLEVAKRENAAILLEEDYKQKYEGFDPTIAESYIIFEFMHNTHMEQSINFASEIQKAFKAAKRSDRGVKQAGLLVLRKTSMPSVLVELGFITNKEEERFLKSASGQNKLAKALYDAFTTFKHEYDRKNGTAADTKKTTTATTAKNTTTTATTYYRIQLLASKTKLKPNAAQLKGYKNVSVYEENGYYKYTYGKSSDPDSIKALQRKIKKDFKDAFIVAFKEGEKLR
jgi:N-acetylmuramoyl-L-alanine amidase